LVASSNSVNNERTTGKSSWISYMMSNWVFYSLVFYEFLMYVDSTSLLLSANIGDLPLIEKVFHRFSSMENVNGTNILIAISLKAEATLSQQQKQRTIEKSAMIFNQQQQYLLSDVAIVELLVRHLESMRVSVYISVEKMEKVVVNIITFGQDIIADPGRFRKKSFTADETKRLKTLIVALKSMFPLSNQLLMRKFRDSSLGSRQKMMAKIHENLIYPQTKAEEEAEQKLLLQKQLSSSLNISSDVDENELSSNFVANPKLKFASTMVLSEKGLDQLRHGLRKADRMRIGFINGGEDQSRLNVIADELYVPLSSEEVAFLVPWAIRLSEFLNNFFNSSNVKINLRPFITVQSLLWIMGTIFLFGIVLWLI